MWAEIIFYNFFSFQSVKSFQLVNSMEIYYLHKTIFSIHFIIHIMEASKKFVASVKNQKKILLCLTMYERIIGTKLKILTLFSASLENYIY